MKLFHKDFKFIFEFQENEKNILIIENPRVFADFISDLCLPNIVKEARFVLSENEIPIMLEDNLCCVVNPLTISLNEKKVVGKLSELLKKEILSSELLLENNKVIADLEKYA